ncbi:acyltransferase domain-containing protein [Piscinibacter terrae]|uniref:Acyltransferase domain-containing protein n=1 Tax=Piscinibacter terrae TaxID=2496871 RepID=A0A3N7IXL4_9BURK|nr:acyltransferase domain-containing protein [Albitalea terrae]RQP23512.1 acyltransferase domain-containing protein [Albitalea terrae]
MGLALLFPGQGAQHQQMLPWLDDHPEARPVLDAMARHLGTDWRDTLGDVRRVHANRVAQLLLTGTGIAAWQVLAAQLPTPTVVAGYSVGELAAFAAAGVFDAVTALDLAAARAQAMDDSVAGRDTGLLAVQGPHALALAEAAADLSIAIRISDERVIVGGDAAALETAAEPWGAAGLRCQRLPIGIASHTRAMAAAAAAFAQRLAAADLRPAQAAVVCNLTGAASRHAAALASALSGQLAHTVRWDDCMDSIAERRPRCVLEVGPGTALAAMWRERHPGIPVRSVEDFQGPEGVSRWVLRQLV